MKRFVAAMLVLGLLLLGVVVARTDLNEVLERLTQLGPGGLVAIFVAFWLGHLALAAS